MGKKLNCIITFVIVIPTILLRVTSTMIMHFSPGNYDNLVMIEKNKFI